MEPLHPLYITGLADAHGCFTYSRSRRRSDETAKGLNLYFAVKMNLCDEPLLRRVRDFFEGVGRIYPVGPRGPANGNSGFTKRAAYYRVSRVRELDVVVRHFDRWPPLGHRNAAFHVWRRMYVVKKRNFRRMGADEYNEIRRLSEELSALSPRNQAWDGP